MLLFSRRLGQICLQCLLSVLGAAALHAEVPKTDVALVLAVDISYSIESSERDLQRQGYVNALRSTEVIRAITRGHYGKVAVTYLEWAGPDEQAQILPWTIIDSAATSYAFAEALESAPLHRSGTTSMAMGLNAASQLFATAPPATRWIIDLSADGYNNAGGSITRARDAALWKGITVNGLAIVTPSSEDLVVYFRDCVIGGPGAALFPVYRIEDFARTLQKKLVFEISGRPIARQTYARVSDCSIGERLAREEYNRQLNALTNGKSERWQLREDDWPSVD